MPNPESTVEGTVAAMKLLLELDEYYSNGETSENGKFAPRTPRMMQEAASEAVNATMERYREAAVILAKNKKEMGLVDCGITDGDSDRKRAAMKEFLKNDI